MADTRALLNGLEEFLQAFSRHATAVQEDFDRLQASWSNLSEVYQGDAAQSLADDWQGTVRVFREHIDSCGDMTALLRERIYALAEANSAKGGD